MKKQEFLDAVAHEAKGIKKHAFKTEIGRLNIDFLEPSHSIHCFYGQMTGNCFSRRAKVLIRKIKPKFMSSEISTSYSTDTFSSMKSSLKKGVVDEMVGVNSVNERSIFSDYTPLELYVTLKGAKNENVINYLKGETKDLVL